MLGLLPDYKNPIHDGCDDCCSQKYDIQINSNFDPSSPWDVCFKKCVESGGKCPITSTPAPVSSLAKQMTVSSTAVHRLTPKPLVRAFVKAAPSVTARDVVWTPQASAPPGVAQQIASGAGLDWEKHKWTLAGIGLILAGGLVYTVIRSRSMVVK